MEGGDKGAFELIQQQELNGKIYCHCVYEYKDKLKNLGFKFDPQFKKWWIQKEKFTEDIFNRSQTIRFYRKASGGTHLRYYYVYYIEKKELIKNLEDNEGDFIE